MTHVESASVQGQLRERDGVIALEPTEHFSVEGDLPRSGDQFGEAYDAIAALEPHRIYKWETVAIESMSGTGDANVLVIRRTQGSDPAQTPYRSRDDLLFTLALDEVARMRDSVRREMIDTGVEDTRGFFRLQAAFLLLFSAVERYCTLRYGFSTNVTTKVERLKTEEAFREALRRVVTRTDEIYRSDTGDRQRLDPENPLEAIRYYYTMRSNIAHRGKRVERDKKRVYDSLSEMHEIFTAVLDMTLGPRGDA